MPVNKKELKSKIIHEFERFLFYSIFLTLFFSAFTTYRLLLEDGVSFNYMRYAYNVVESLILAKIILIGQAFKLGEHFSDRSLIIPTLYKSFIFLLFVMAFLIIEHYTMGYLEGKSLALINQEFLSKGINQILANLLIMAFVFVFFFAFLEIGRVLGEEKLLKLFIDRKHLKE